jgi:hypothetical protein
LNVSNTVPDTNAVLSIVTNTVPNVREMPLPAAVAAVLRVTVVPETAVTVVLAAIPVPVT